MFKMIITILLIVVIAWGAYIYYTKDDEGEYLTFQVKAYDIDKLSSDYKELSGTIWGVYLCSRNEQEEGTEELTRLMKRERFILVKKVNSKTYEGKVYLTYLKDPNKQYYIVCPASYTLGYIDSMTEAQVDFSNRNVPLTIYWAYPPNETINAPG